MCQEVKDPGNVPSAFSGCKSGWYPDENSSLSLPAQPTPTTNQNQTQTSAQNRLIPADSQTPVAGICAGPSTDQVVTVTIGLDNVPQPRCTKVTANQKLKIINNKNQTMQGSIGQYTITIVSGQNQIIDAPFGSYLAPGVHEIVGAEIWLQ